MTDEIVFADWLKQELAQRHWSQVELARVSNISAAVINKTIRQRSKRPDPETLAGIARALGKAPETLFRLAHLLPARAGAPEMDDVEDLVEQMPPEVRATYIDIGKQLLCVYQEGKHARE